MQFLVTRAPLAASAAVIAFVPTLWPGMALAQASALDSAAESLEVVLTHGGERLRDWTQSLLLFLLVLDFVWRGGKWLITGQSIAAFAEAMLYTIGIVSLAWGFTVAGPEVVGWIAEEATALATGGQSGIEDQLTPSGIMSAGIDRTQQWIAAVRATDPVSWAFFVCAFISLVVLAAELAMVILVYAELFLVGLVGIATLGFAGLTQTRSIASRYVMALVGKGFKLLTLLLVVDATHRVALRVVDTSMVRPLAECPDVFIDLGAGNICHQVTSVSLEGVLSAMLMQVVGGVLVIMLPGAVERLVGGSSVGDIAGTGGKMVAGAAAAGMMTGGAAALGAAGGAAAPVASSAARVAKTGGSFGVKETAKAALTGGLQGGVNWGSLAKSGKLTNELGRRLRSGVNSIGAGKGNEGGGS